MPNTIRTLEKRLEDGLTRMEGVHERRLTEAQQRAQKVTIFLLISSRGKTYLTACSQINEAHSFMKKEET